MAGDWIKMRVELYRDPKICVMADLLMDQDSDLARYINQNTQRDSNVTRNVMRNAVVGALVSIWGIARVQGKRVDNDLLMESATIGVLDDIADMPGIGDAMLTSRWVEESEEGLIFPRFFELHNEDYADQRRKNRERQARYRERKQAEERNVTVTSRNAPREEKRREEKSIEDNTPYSPPRGTGGESRSEVAERIYQAYPRKVGKAKAIKAITLALRRDGPDAITADDLLAAVQEFARAVDGADPQFIPHPATWFNQARWTDDRDDWRRIGRERGQPATTHHDFGGIQGFLNEA